MEDPSPRRSESWKIRVLEDGNPPDHQQETALCSNSRAGAATSRARGACKVSRPPRQRAGQRIQKWSAWRELKAKGDEHEPRRLRYPLVRAQKEGVCPAQQRLLICCWLCVLERRDSHRSDVSGLEILAFRQCFFFGKEN